MPKSRFRLTVREWREIHELPESWPPERLRRVLELTDFEDTVSDEDAHDMALMALQDLEPRVAGEVALEAVFGERMSSGVRQNLADDLEADRPWEQFAGVNEQAGIFEAVVLLQRAFPTRFGVPDAVRLVLEVHGTDAETRAWLDGEPQPALLLRLLAAGMDGNAVLTRLYEAELAGNRFPDAASILWRISELKDAAGDGRIFEIYSSNQWLGPLEDRDAWEASGWPDGVEGA